jgi:hypothetical protein
MAAVPGATAEMVNVAVDAPAAIATDAGTVATAALLLASVTVAPVDGAALSVTVPCSLPPAATLGVLSDTAEIAVPELVGDVEEPPHCAALRRPITAAGSATSDGMRLMMYLMPAEVSTTVPRALPEKNGEKSARQRAIASATRIRIE